jgi:hypothetical protein
MLWTTLAQSLANLILRRRRSLARDMPSLHARASKISSSRALWSLLWQVQMLLRIALIQSHATAAIEPRL